ncbi:MAG: hypothetical protein ACD_76C00147G0006 [uncultured bacterium]|nr:MAG: hypothetical protein ACD_76C00147G0006 [uncultured bacterium]HBD05437.1 hypothetical protein [Candidatus Uhrbacteria bacterium]
MKTVIALLLLAIFIPQSASAAHIRTIPVEIWNLDGTRRAAFEVPMKNDGGGGVIEVADLGTDGVPEIIIGNGLGNEPRVTMYRLDGSIIGSFLAYAPSADMGVTVTSCDINSDGKKEIITGTQLNGGPHVRVFNSTGESMNLDFFAYEIWQRSGVSVKCADIDSDGQQELITAPGQGSSPLVKILNLTNGQWIEQTRFYAFSETDLSGVTISVADNLMLAGHQTGTDNAIHANVIHSPATEQFSVNAPTNTSVTPFGVDLNNDNKLEIGFVSNTRNAQVKIINGSSNITIKPKTTRSVSVAVYDIDNDGKKEIITVPTRPMHEALQSGKYIRVSVPEQRLDAYENGALVRTFLVSTGTYAFPTPTGLFSVLEKVPVVNYSWSYGANNANNYNLGPTPYNLRFKPHFYIHYAPWHNNFGHRMSHGCVNVNLENIKWIYNWAEKNTPVLIEA